MAARARWLRWSVMNVTALEELMQPPYGDRAVVRRSDGELIGACGLVPSLIPLARSGAEGFGRQFFPEVGLYYALSSDTRGHGYATEAARALCSWSFKQLKLARIIATTEHDNHASIGVMQRLGMRILRHAEAAPAWLQVVGVLEAPGDAIDR